MQKTKLGVIFGGMSTENKVSVVSANSVLKNLVIVLYQFIIKKSIVFDKFQKISYHLML